MTTKAKSYNTNVGHTSIVISEQAFCRIDGVWREGVRYNVVYSGTPGNRQVLYKSNEGRFTFNTSFAFAEKIYVLSQR